ncbi:MAG TPA: CNNM domain-containing protein, partial [Anaerolineales bacterium]
MLFWNILLVLLLVALNAFFVSVEFAAVTSRRSRIEMLAGSGNRAARIVKTWLENPAARDRLIAASQLGITIVSLALGAVGENTFQVLLQPLFQNLNLPGSYQVISRLLPALPLVLALIIVTSLHVVMGEQVPKVATLQDPERVALLAARPMQIFSTIFKWFISLLDWATRQVLGWAGIEMMGEHTLMYSVEEIKHILSESEEGGVIEPPEREMLDAIFDLGDLLARQVMVPRTEIVAVEANTPLP